MSTFNRLTTLEGGIEYWDGSTKIAFINDSGTVQATRGNADRKDELLPWIAEKYPADLGESAPESDEKAEHSEDLSPNGGQGDPDTREQEGGGSSAAFVHETKDSPLSVLKEVSKIRNELAAKGPDIPPVCPLPGNSQAGSKSPEVVAWWFDNHPELARVKYAKHKHLWPSQP